MAEFRKKKSRLPFRTQREKTIRQVKNRHVHDVKVAVADYPQSFKREIHLFSGKLPRRRTRFAQAGGEKSVIDVIRLAAKFLKFTAGETQVALFDKNIGLVKFAGLVLHVELHRIRRFDFPLRVIDGYVAFGLNVLCLAVELNLVGSENCPFPGDLDIAARANFRTRSEEHT